MNNAEAALFANINALAGLLAEAAQCARDAADAAAAGHRNLAVGTLLQIERTVPDAQAIMAATLALHRLAPQR